MYGFSISLLLWLLNELFEVQAFFVIGLIWFGFLLIYGLVYMNTGDRFKRA